MKVYLAAPYASRGLVREYAVELESAGITVTSSWLNESHEVNSGTTGAATALSDAQVREHVEADFRDVARADVLAVFTAAAVGMEGGSGGSGGRHIETGYALALGKPVLVIGEPENIFQRGICTVVPDWRQAVLELTALAR